MSVITSIVSVWDWIFLDVCYSLCCCTFLCSFISQASTTIAMTTAPLVTVVSSGLSSLSLVTVAHSLMGIPAKMGQSDVILLPLLTPRCSKVL